MCVALAFLGGCSEALDGEESPSSFDDLDLVERSNPPPPVVLGQTDVTDRYLGMPGTGHNECGPAVTCIRADLVDRYNGGGGWFRVETAGGWFDPLDAEEIQYVEPRSTLAYDVDVDYEAMGVLTDAQLTDFAVVARVIVRPHNPAPGGAQPEQLFEHVFDGGQDDLHRFEFEPNWVDSDVEVRVEITSPLIEAPIGGYALTETRRVRSTPNLRISPKFLPVAIIGRPPGANSWGEIGYSSSQTVKIGVNETTTQTSSVSNEFGIGYGASDYDVGNSVVERRREAEGTFRNVGWRGVSLVRADSSLHRNGDGDLLVVLEDPDVDLWNAPADRDFQVAHPGITSFVPMAELVLHRDGLNGIGPGSSNTFVNRLNRDEVVALIGLHPLTEYPSWHLNAPRYHLLRTAVRGQGGTFNQAFEITTTDVERATSSSSRAEIMRTSSGFKLPISSIVKDIFDWASPLGLLSAQASGSRINSTEVELVRSLEVLDSAGVVYRYSLSDNSYEEFCSEAYWDTLFNTVVFRDCGTPDVSEGLLAAYSAEFAVDIDFDRYSKHESLLSGNLGGSKESIELTEHTTGWSYSAEVNEIGNFAIPNLRPGRYLAKQSLSGDVYTIELSKDDELTIFEGEEE